MMTRRKAILALLSMPLARFTVMRVKAQGRPGPTEPAPRVGKARLTLDLDKWSGIEVTYKGEATFFTAAEIFRALTTGE